MKRLEKEEKFLVSQKEESKQMQAREVRDGRRLRPDQRRRKKTRGTSAAFAKWRIRQTEIVLV